MIILVFFGTFLGILLTAHSDYTLNNPPSFPMPLFPEQSFQEAWEPPEWYPPPSFEHHGSINPNYALPSFGARTLSRSSHTSTPTGSEPHSDVTSPTHRMTGDTVTRPTHSGPVVSRRLGSSKSKTAPSPKMPAITDALVHPESQNAPVVGVREQMINQIETNSAVSFHKRNTTLLMAVCDDLQLQNQRLRQKSARWQGKYTEAKQHPASTSSKICVDKDCSNAAVAQTSCYKTLCSQHLEGVFKLKPEDLQQSGRIASIGCPYCGQLAVLLKLE